MTNSNIYDILDIIGQRVILNKDIYDNVELILVEFFIEQILMCDALFLFYFDINNASHIRKYFFWPKFLSGILD